MGTPYISGIRIFSFNFAPTGWAMGNGYIEGQAAGEEFHTLTVQELPAHTHALTGNNAVVGASNNSTVATPTNNFFANSGKNVFASGAPNAKMSPATVTTFGGSQPHSSITMV